MPSYFQTKKVFARSDAFVDPSCNRSIRDAGCLSISIVGVDLSRCYVASTNISTVGSSVVHSRTVYVSFQTSNNQFRSSIATDSRYRAQRHTMGHGDRFTSEINKEQKLLEKTYFQNYGNALQNGLKRSAEVAFPENCHRCREVPDLREVSGEFSLHARRTCRGCKELVWQWSQFRLSYGHY